MVQLQNERAAWLCRGGWAAQARWEYRKDALRGNKIAAAGTTQPGRAGWVTLALCKPPSEVSSVGRSWNEGRWAGQVSGCVAQAVGVLIRGSKPPTGALVVTPQGQCFVPRSFPPKEVAEVTLRNPQPWEVMGHQVETPRGEHRAPRDWGGRGDSGDTRDTGACLGDGDTRETGAELLQGSAGRSQSAPRFPIPHPNPELMRADPRGPYLVICLHRELLLIKYGGLIGRAHTDLPQEQAPGTLSPSLVLGGF